MGRKLKERDGKGWDGKRREIEGKRWDGMGN